MSDEREIETEEVLPIIEEMLTVGKRTIETGTVRVRTIVDEEQVTLNDQLARETIEVERVPMNSKVDIAPPDRDEGGTIVISIVEERFVLENYCSWSRRSGSGASRPPSPSSCRQRAALCVRRSNETALRRRTSNRFHEIRRS